MARTLRKQFAPAGGWWRETETEVVESGEGGDAPGDRERHERDDDRDRVRKDVTEYHASVARSECARCKHVSSSLFFVCACAHVPRHGHPPKDHHNDHQRPEVRDDDRSNDHDDVEKGHVGPNLDNPLKEEVKGTSPKSHGAAKCHPNRVVTN